MSEQRRGKGTKKFTVARLCCIGTCILFGVIILIVAGSLYCREKCCVSTDELETAVCSFYKQHERAPADLSELVAYSVSNNLAFDKTGFGDLEMIATNAYRPFCWLLIQTWLIV